MRKTNKQVIEGLYNKYKDEKGVWKDIEPELDDITSALVYSSQPPEEVVDSDMLEVFWNIYSGMVKNSEKEIRKNKLNIKQAYEFIREDLRASMVEKLDSGESVFTKEQIVDEVDPDKVSEMKKMNKILDNAALNIKKEIPKKKN